MERKSKYYLETDAVTLHVAQEIFNMELQQIKLDDGHMAHIVDRMAAQLGRHLLEQKMFVMSTRERIERDATELHLEFMFIPINRGK